MPPVSFTINDRAQIGKTGYEEATAIALQQPGAKPALELDPHRALARARSDIRCGLHPQAPIDHLSSIARRQVINPGLD